MRGCGGKGLRQGEEIVHVFSVIIRKVGEGGRGLGHNSRP
jgi:hypothetical protein